MRVRLQCERAGQQARRACVRVKARGVHAARAGSRAFGLSYLVSKKTKNGPRLARLTGEPIPVIHSVRALFPADGVEACAEVARPLPGLWPRREAPYQSACASPFFGTAVSCGELASRRGRRRWLCGPPFLCRPEKGPGLCRGPRLDGWSPPDTRFWGSSLKCFNAQSGGTVGARVQARAHRR